MKFEPWNEFTAPLPELPIAAPPCPGCRHWRPVPLFTNQGKADGVRLCHALDMHHDFSCYREREEPG